MARLTWTRPADAGGIQGYQTGIDRAPDGLADSAIGVATAATMGPLASGDLYFHVRAVDWAGNRGAVTTFRLRIDHRAPALGHVAFERFQFNPQYDRLTMHFVPSKDVTVRAEILRQSTKGLVRVIAVGAVKAGRIGTVTWDGRNARGVLVNPDKYTMTVYATDALGNVGSGFYADLGVNLRRIVIHLASQSLEAYDGQKLLRGTLVTTGNQLLPTPQGIWHVGAKFHPYKFISPWKKGSPYYYEPAKVGYALYFHQGGYFIHDAPWRGVFGPGTNTQPGPPGVYSGTHGCVNVTPELGKWLYDWAPIGTVVDVRQ